MISKALGASRVLVGAATLAFGLSADAQVNTEAMSADVADEGWAYELGAHIGLQRGNTESTSAGASTALRFLTPHEAKLGEEDGEPWFYDRLLATGDWTIEATDGERAENNAFGHLRWTRMWHPHVGHELFFQAEFDEFRRLDRRILFGADVRVVLANEELVQAWYGTGYFIELEQFDLSDADRLVFERRTQNHRWTNYFAFKVNDVKERVRWVNTIYVQPRFDELKDFQLLFESDLNIALVGPLSLGIALDVHHDSRPAPGVEETDIELVNSLELSF